MTGHKIAMLRTQANLTQEQLAEKLYVTRELVSKWETGKRNPDYKTIVKLAEIFSVNTDEIINHIHSSMVSSEVFIVPSLCKRC